MSTQLPASNPLAYLGLKETNPPQLWFRNRPPTAADYKNYDAGDDWVDQTANQFWKCIKIQGQVATWVGAAAAGAVNLLRGNDLVDVGPDIANRINLVGVPGTNGINITGVAGTNTVTVGLNSPFLGDFEFRNNAAATPRVVTVRNTDADPGSGSALYAQAAFPGGDAFTIYGAGAFYYSTGIDSSDARRYKITDGADPSSGVAWAILDSAASTWFYPCIVFNQTIASVGGTVNRLIYNTDNTDANSNAGFNAQVGGASSGDPFITFTIGAITTQYSIGPDNSVAGDPLKITTGSTPSAGTTIFQITTAGAVTFNSAFTFPTADGAANTVLTTNGAGVVTWQAGSISPTTCAIGDVIYGSAVNTYSNLAFDNTATRYLANTGGGATIPAWDQVNLTNGVTGILPVGSGGTGAISFTDHAVLVGSAATAITAIAVGLSGTILIGVTGADPTWTTATYPSTAAVGDILYGSALNTITGLAFVNTATRYLKNTGTGATLPEWGQVDLTDGVTGTLPVSSGGTGAVALTDHALLVGSGVAGITSLAVLGNGELAIGSAGADPVPASLTQPAAGLTITGGAGSITFALADDLLALEGIAGTGLAVRTAANTWTTRSLAAPAAGFTITNTDGVAGNPTFVLADDLAALEALATTGVASRTGASTWATSTITQNSLVYGNATQGLTNLGVLTDGQLAIGSTGAAPVAATITAGANITVTNAAGSITIASTGGGIAPATCAIGDVIYGSALNTYSNLAFVSTATRYLSNTGGGATIPAWAQVDLTNGVTGVLPVGNAGLGVANPTDHAVLVGSGAAAVTPISMNTNGMLLIGSNGADPVAATLASAGGTVTITNGAGTINLEAAGGGLTYAEETGATKTIVINYAYGANRAGGVAFALPATAAAGSVVEIIGIQGNWSITQGAGQQIRYGDISTTAGAGGSLTATDAGDCLKIRCTVANTTWTKQNSVGNITVV